MLETFINLTIFSYTKDVINILRNWWVLSHLILVLGLLQLPKYL